MRCTKPRTVGFKTDGKSLAWSFKDSSKEFATFQLPCGKCISCRLEYARQWAIRCVHEAQMHPSNCFITLTYSETNLKSPKLNYEDFQKFMKRLRAKYPEQPIGCFVTGEYGEKTKRPHWHAILFNFEFPDATFLRTNERGDRIATSAILDEIWGLNDPEKKPNEIGGVTFESAGYVARYAAKKLVHGNDDEHDYQPISKKSSRYAIGKAFLEKYYEDIFNEGQVVLKTGQTASIPRYYEKWLKQHQPQAWNDYVTRLKLARMKEMTAISEAELTKEREVNCRRRDRKNPKNQVTRAKAQEKIVEARFAILQKHLKNI